MGDVLRPRISRKEAQFILDCLKAKKEELIKVQQKYEELKAEVAKLRHVIMYDAYEAVIKQDLPKKRDELKIEDIMTYTLLLFKKSSI